jgi:hypothetical protein
VVGADGGAGALGAQGVSRPTAGSSLLALPAAVEPYDPAGSNFRLTLFMQ